MQAKLVCASHSPLIYFPASETSAVSKLRESFAAVKKNIETYDPDLVVMFGCDHYGGHQMASMPAFCVGVEATALEDIGGAPGKFKVPRQIAVHCVNALRADNVDVAVSYAMEVDHGFSQTLKETCGEIARYPVLPIFICSLQPPFVPFRRGRALGAAVSRFLQTLDCERVLIIGTGGLSHDPEKLFPPIDDVSPEWKPYHLLGTRQNEVSRERWMKYESDAHYTAAGLLSRNEFPVEALKINEAWDTAFLDLLEHGKLSAFDDWTPEAVIRGGGFGAMETLVWVTAAQAMDHATGQRPRPVFYAAMPEVAIGFGIAETEIAPVRKLAAPQETV